MLSGYGNNPQGYFLWPERPHPVFLGKLRGVVMFLDIYGIVVNYGTKCVCVLMIEICIKCSESNIADFLGRILCTSAYACIFICIVV